MTDSLNATSRSHCGICGLTYISAVWADARIRRAMNVTGEVKCPQADPCFWLITQHCRVILALAAVTGVGFRAVQGHCLRISC